MQLIKDQIFEGERPLYRAADVALEGVTIQNGESALKECRNIEADNCNFLGKYPLWLIDRLAIRNSYFGPDCRASLWYNNNTLIENSRCEAPKAMRDCKGVTLRNFKSTKSVEMLWQCSEIDIADSSIEEADYLFFHCDNIKIRNLKMQGNYTFQYCSNIVIEDSVINTKDAFWNTKNVVVRNSTITGQYLAWHSENVRFVNCHIDGTQPLCYCDNLVLENCTFGPLCDLAFEYSTVRADIKSNIVSVKNPTSGIIEAQSIGEILLDENIKQPANCIIKTEKQ